MHYYSITYNDKNSWEMRMPVKWRPTIPAPELRQDLIEIPGRDGAMVSTIKQYAPIEIPVEMNYMALEDQWGDMYRKAKRWIKGSGRLEQSDDTEWYFRVIRASIIEPERTSKRIGSFTALFVCDPYTYRKDGLYQLAVGSVISNAWDVCHPIYIVTGTGTATLTVNGNQMQIAVNGTAYIDTDLMIAYNGSRSALNTSVIGDYAKFYLQEGDNTISITSGFGLQVIPNWRAL